MSPAILSAAILLISLILFVSERVRHDLIAVFALVASLCFGLVAPEEALSGFSDHAVIAVAAVLVVGRALELTGVASHAARLIMPAHLPFSLKLAMLMGLSATLSAFMNNIAALVITMPIAIEIARTNNRAPGSTLMPLAFASILGGMTTLIGTPANLILSSVRERELGAPFGFFSMTSVGLSVCAVGLVYLALLGWRLLPVRPNADNRTKTPWRVFELTLLEPITIERSALKSLLRSTKARLLRVIRANESHIEGDESHFEKDDKLLVLSRSSAVDVAAALPLPVYKEKPDAGAVTARMVVAYGSPLVGQNHQAVTFQSAGQLSVNAAGPRAAKVQQPLMHLAIQPGDQLFISGPPGILADFSLRMRLLEIDRVDKAHVNWAKVVATLVIFVSAIAVIIMSPVSPAISFLAAAALIAGLRLMPATEVYSAIDWSVIVLLAAMIPVGNSFQSSGAAAIIASFLGEVLSGWPLPWAIGAMCATTMLLSIFLNNVATSVIMGPLSIKVAGLLAINPDALLLAVLIGTSSDFLTPIGHQNNLLVMGPGGYKFSDYARSGAILSILVIITASLVLAHLYQ